MTAIVTRGDAAHLHLPDATVDLIVTSPPYFGLRSYQDGGEHYDGQIGAEATPAEYLDALIACTAEWMRVLKPSGSIFVNLGDKYQSTAPGTTNSPHRKYGTAAAQAAQFRPDMGVRPKSLVGFPWRYAIRCIDELGLILRAEIVWAKCLSGGARIYARTSTGDRPIMLRDLVRSYRAEDVQLWNGEKWTQVLGWERTPDDDGALEFELRTGERIGCTTNHRWPTQRGILFAEDIRVGDVIKTTRLPEPEPPRTPALLPAEDIGWLIGLYIAEGSRSETTVQFAGHVKEEARHTRLARIAAALDGTCSRYQISENGETINLRGSVIVGVLDRYISAGTAKTKRLRHAAWQRSDAFLSAVVDGYLSGDGHYDAKNDRWRLGFTANDEWAADLRTLAARVGAVCRLRRTQHVSNHGTFPGWRGEWRWNRSAHWNAKADGEVVAIRRSRARDFYDVTVADDPHLFALASGVLTHNSNGLPESVTDRVRRSHEQVFHFVKQPRYYSAVDEVREQSATIVTESGAVRYRKPGEVQEPRTRSYTAASKINADRGDSGMVGSSGNPLGRLPGSVWSIPTSPLQVPDWRGVEAGRVIRYFAGRASRADADAWLRAGGSRRRSVRPMADHFAAYPPELVRRIVLGWSPHGGTIVDPFGGTGTTALVASVHGRVGISVDLSADYCRSARWRTTDEKQRAKVVGVKPKPHPKAPLTVPGQLNLFAEPTA